ncbi:hypothetical protein Tco_0342124, partial [Tanacetum coccineum]
YEPHAKDKALLMEAKEKGDVLDAEAEAFLADTNHEDAYDSNVDEGPNAAVAFMANLSSTGATNNTVNEVHCSNCSMVSGFWMLKTYDR